MRLRRRWVLVWSAGLVLVLPWLLWGGYAGLAVLRHEHIYHGLPTSYWERAVRAWLPPFEPLPDWVPDCLAPMAQYFGLTGRPAVLESDPAAVPVLGDLLRSDDAHVRELAAHTIYAIGPAASSAATGLLIAAALDPIPEDRRGWGFTAAQAAHSALHDMGEAVVPALLDALVQQHDPRLRREAAIALNRQETLPTSALPILGRALCDPDARVREKLLWALYRVDGWGTAAGAEVLGLALRDPEPLVRQAALHAVYRGGPLPAERRILALLVESLTKPETSVRMVAAYALAGMGQAALRPGAVEVVPALLQALRDPEERVRAAAANALWAVSPEAARKAGVMPPPQESRP
jgi:HEAT repeat protein